MTQNPMDPYQIRAHIRIERFLYLLSKFNMTLCSVFGVFLIMSINFDSLYNSPFYQSVNQIFFKPKIYIFSLLILLFIFCVYKGIKAKKALNPLMLSEDWQRIRLEIFLFFIVYSITIYFHSHSLERFKYVYPSNTTNQTQQYESYSQQRNPNLSSMEEKFETVEDEFFYSGDIESIETEDDSNEEGLDAFNSPELTF